MNKIKTILLITVLLLLAGCEKYFFFPKQQLFYMPETCANSPENILVDKRNFRKRIAEMDYIEKTDKIDKTGSKRGAALYQFNEKAYRKAPKFKL